MPDFDQFGIPKKTAQTSAKVDAFGIPIKGPVQPPVDTEQIRRVPSFREFAASKGLSIEKQRQMAEGTYGPDLAMKAKMDRDVEEAPERRRTKAIQEGARKNEALINTTRKRLNGKGVKYEDFDPIFKKELESTRADVDSGVLVLSEDNARNPVYKQGLGFVESLGYALKQSVDESIVAARFDRADSRERQKIAEEEMKKEQELVPTGVGGKIGEILGGAAPLIAEARAGAIIGTEVAGPGYGTMAGIIGSVLATLPDAFSKGRKAEAIKRYNQEIEQIGKVKGVVTQEDKDAAMQRASAVGIVGGISEAAVVSGLSLIAPGGQAAGRGLMNAVKNWGKHAAYDATRQSALGVTSEVVKGTAASIAGYNVSAGDIIEDAVRRGGSDAEMALAFSAYHATLGVPKYVKSAAKNYLSTLPRPELNNLSESLEGQGAIPKGATSKMNLELDAFEQAKNEFQGLVPDEDMGAFAGLALKKKNLEEKIKNTTLAPVRAKLQEESDAIDVRISDMLKSKNPVVDEVNDLTGDTGEAEILTEDRVQETVDNVYRQPINEPTRYDLKPTVSIEGREYYGTDHGEAMKRAIEAGEDVPSPDTPEGQVWREQNGLFRERDRGELLTRDEAEAKYGVRRSQDLKPVTDVVPVIEEAAPMEAPKYTREQARQIISEIDVPTSADGLAMWALATGSKVNYESFKAETGGKSEAYGSGFTATNKEKAPSVSKLAEQLWVDYIPEDMKSSVTDADIRDKLIDFMQSYKNKSDISQEFIRMYSPEVAAREAEGRYATADELIVLDDVVYTKPQYDNFLKQVGEVEESARISDEYVDYLIKEYEQGITREGEQAPTAAEGRPTEQVVPARVAEEVREVVGEVARRLGDDAEVSEFENYSKAERSRPEFDAEYRAERVDGESVEQYILRKYCR